MPLQAQAPASVSPRLARPVQRPRKPLDSCFRGPKAPFKADSDTKIPVFLEPIQPLALVRPRNPEHRGKWPSWGQKRLFMRRLCQCRACLAVAGAMARPLSAHFHARNGPFKAATTPENMDFLSTIQSLALVRPQSAPRQSKRRASAPQSPRPALDIGRQVRCTRGDRCRYSSSNTGWGHVKERS